MKTGKTLLVMDFVGLAAQISLAYTTTTSSKYSLVFLFQ